MLSAVVLQRVLQISELVATFSASLGALVSTLSTKGRLVRRLSTTTRCVKRP